MARPNPISSEIASKFTILKSTATELKKKYLDKLAVKIIVKQQSFQLHENLK